VSRARAASHWRWALPLLCSFAAACYPEFDRSAFDESSEDVCNDGVDNDENGVTDCDEPRCADTLACAPDAAPPDGLPLPDAAPDAAPDACVAELTSQFCARLGSECDLTTGDDLVCGTERTENCGLCTWPESCAGAGEEHTCGCTPTTCYAEQKNCGDMPDGCGGTEFCGECTLPDTCGGIGIPNRCGCTPTSCIAEGKNCDTISDGCYSTLFCGVCTGGETCAGGGIPNVCG